jgi:ATP-dependent exoDNAse (exonuclease V) beta subunit
MKFNKKKHTYKKGKDEYISVTTFLKQFFKPFDERKVAKFLTFLDKRKGIKTGVRHYLKQWKADREHGTRVHELIQTSDESLIKEPRDFDKWKQAQKFIEKNITYSVEDEMLVAASDLKLAGTIDYLGMTGNGLHLVDWKTNKSINTTAYKNEKCKEPLQHLDDCNFQKYRLQLLLYSYILETYYGLNIAKVSIVHLKETEFVVYDIPKDYSDVMKIVAMRKV